MTTQQERLYAMNMLGLASSPTDATKATSMAQLAKIASDVARRKTWKDLERHAFVKLIQKIAQALGIRLTKAKLIKRGPSRLGPPNSPETFRRLWGASVDRTLIRFPAG
jgi:hypothetical protein